MPILTPMSASAPARAVAVPTAVVVVVAALVAVFAVVGLVVSLTSDRLPTGPALSPPGASHPAVTFDPTTRKAGFDTVAVTMPASPYECPDKPDAVSPLLASGLMCQADVHVNYQGTSDWSATAGFGSVPDELARPTPEGTAKAFFQEFRTQGFGQQKTTLSDYQTQRAMVGGHEVVGVVGHVHYKVAGLASRYDRVVVFAVPVPDSGFVIYFSSRPDDTPTSVLDPLNASINSLRIS